MNRAALEHLLRAAAAITGETTFYVVGTAAIVASLKTGSSVAPVVLRSREADLIPASASPQAIDLIDGALGQDSTFDGTFGYYADGVDFQTITYAPDGWRDRVVRFESAATNGACGLCMDPSDLAVAKLCAGREKDLEFVKGLLQSSLVAKPELEQRLTLVRASGEVLKLAADRLQGF
jgi:hypothetical protein